jgi:hypothetical protein
LRDCSVYGFTYKASLDSVARHEAYHAFYYWVIGNKALGINLDNDNDYLPYVGPNSPPAIRALTGMFDYSLDSSDNKYGSFGPKAVALIDWNPNCPAGYTYQGDGQYDQLNKKVFLTKWNPDRVISQVGSGDPIIVDLPRNIPISKYWEHYLYVRAISKQVPALEYAIVLPLIECYWPRMIEQKTYAPKLQIKLTNRKKWDELMQRYDIEGVYFYYALWNPKSHNLANQEYDACKIGGRGIYTADWKEPKWQIDS